MKLSQAQRLDQVAHALRSQWIEGGGEITRHVFEYICRDRCVEPDLVQAIFEGLPGFRVEKNPRDSRRNDKFIFTIYGAPEAA